MNEIKRFLQKAEVAKLNNSSELRLSIKEVEKLKIEIVQLQSHLKSMELLLEEKTEINNKLKDNLHEATNQTQITGKVNIIGKAFKNM